MGSLALDPPVPGGCFDQHPELPVQTDHNSFVPTEQGSGPGAAVSFPGLLCSPWKLLDPAATMEVCVQGQEELPSVLPSADREVQCIPWFGKEAELLGAVLSKSWNTDRGSRTPAFVFSLTLVMWAGLSGIPLHPSP